MNCLVTGHNGFLAKNLTQFFKQKYNVYAISRKKNKKNLLNVITLDLSKKDSFKKIKLQKIDFVIHVAAVIMSNKVKAKTIIIKNLNIINNLIKILKMISFKKIINISSISLYPNNDGKFNEESQINFFDNNDYPYAYSKYITEKKINENFPSNKILHLRVAQIIGNQKDTSIITNLKREIKKKNKLSIFGNGKRVLNLIHVKKIPLYIDLSLKKKLFGIYNISDYSFSLKKIAEVIKKKYGNKNTKILYKRKNKFNPRFIIDNKKFFSKLRLKKLSLNDLINEI